MGDQLPNKTGLVPHLASSLYVVIDGETRMTTNAWGKWIGRHWKELEPEMKKALTKAFKHPLYAGEFEDIIQEFVAYLLTRSTDRTPDEWDAGAKPWGSQVYLVAHWCVKRGVAIRSTDTRRKESLDASVNDVELDDLCMCEGAQYPESYYEETQELLARCEATLQGHNYGARFFEVWELWKKGIPFIEMAETMGVTPATVNSIVKNAKLTLRKELKDDVKYLPLVENWHRRQCGVN